MKVLYTYVASSVLSVIAIVYYAFSTRGHFYPSVLYLASSKVALVVGGNMVVALSILFGQLLVKIFFNVLKDGEVEILIELLKYEAMETVFAFALFRNEISPQVVLFFLGLLFLKAFHLIAKTRVQYLEQVMPVSISTHVRLQGVILTLFAADLAIANYCVQSTLAGGSTILILFGFEFGLLVIAAFNTMTKYYLHVLDSYLSRGLVGKGLYIMILEVLCDAFRVVTYVMFFCLIYSYYGLPLHILREVWVSFVMFQRRLVSFIKYLKLIQNLETKFVSATPEEIADAGDCLVCRETMESGKKLPCGHVFHVDCLRMWLQHQQSCPLCRADIPVTGVGEQRAQEEPADAGDAAALRAVQNVIQAEAAAAAREAAMAAAEAAAVAEVVTTDTVTAVEDAATFHSTSVSTPVPDQQPIAEAEIMIETTEPGNHVNATPAVETSIEQSSVTELKRVAAGSPVDPYDITKSISATASPTVTPVKPAVSPVAPLNAKDATRARWANISLGSMAAKTEAASMSSPTPTRTSSVTVSSSAVLDLEVDVATGADSERTVEEFPETFGGDIVISTPEKKPGEDLVNHSDDLGDTAFGEEPVGQQESPPVALSAPALTPVLAEKECADNVALSSASDIEREIMRLVTPSISVPIHPSTVVAAAAAAQPDSASTTASLIVGPYRHYALWVHTLPRFVMLVPGPAARANTQTSSGSSAISGSSSSDRSVDASTNTSIPPVCVFSMPGQALPVVRTFPNCKTVILAQRYLSARGVDTGIGSFTDTNMRIWLQIADGYIQLPSSQEVAAGMHQYTVEPYDPVVTLGQAGAQTRSVFPSQDDYKADYLRQISELLPRSTRLPEPVSTSSSSSSVGAVPGTESDFLAAGVSNETLLEHIKFLHSHVSSLTSGMEQLQQQLALTQLINKQLVSMTQLQDRAIAQNDSNSK